MGQAVAALPPHSAESLRLSGRIGFEYEKAMPSQTEA